VYVRAVAAQELSGGQIDDQRRVIEEIQDRLQRMASELADRLPVHDGSLAAAEAAEAARRAQL